MGNEVSSQYSTVGKRLLNVFSFVISHRTTLTEDCDLSLFLESRTWAQRFWNLIDRSRSDKFTRFGP